MQIRIQLFASMLIRVQLLRIRIPFHFNADPDPTFHFNADPYPAFCFNAGSDSAFQDPDVAFHLNVDPDPAPHKRYANLRPLVLSTSKVTF